MDGDQGQPEKQDEFRSQIDALSCPL
jgi:hypothetical protein